MSPLSAITTLACLFLKDSGRMSGGCMVWRELFGRNSSVEANSA